MLALSALVLITLVLSLSMAAAPAVAAPHAPVLLRCEPSSYQGYADTEAAIELYAEGATDMYGVDVQLSFDPAIGQVVDKGSTPGVQLEPLYDWFVPGYIIKNYACNTASSGDCATAGQLRYAATQMNPQPPIPATKPNGPLAIVTFQAQQLGTFTMSFLYHKVSDINGSEIPSTVQPCTVQFQPPLAVDLAYQSAEVVGAAVQLTWETVSEQDLAGFDVYRADAASGPWIKANAMFIPARSPGATAGNTYTWADSQVAAGHDYLYVLEDLSPSGVKTRHDPLAVRTAAPNAVTVRRFDAQRTALPSPLLWPLALLAALAPVAVRFAGRR